MLEEGRTIPSCSICSNSRRATFRRSGGRRRVRALTGGPFVWRWCVTPCLTSQSPVWGRSKVGNSRRIAWNSFAGFFGRSVRLGEVV